MATWGILNLIASDVRGISKYDQRGIELSEYRPWSSPNSNLIYLPRYGDSLYFVGFVSDKQDLKFDNCIFKILTEYVGGDISGCIIDYAYGSLDKLSEIKLITKKIDDNKYLHYFDLSKKHLILDDGCRFIELDNPVMSYVINCFVNLDLEHIQSALRLGYDEYHSNYITVEEKKSDVVLDLTHKQQEFDITTQVLRSTGEKPEDDQHGCGCHTMHHNNFGLNGYLLRFRMPAIEYIESIQLTANGVSAKYDKLYMQHIEQLICFDKNIFAHKSNTDDYAISFTNGYFGCMSLRRYSYFTMTIHYDESKISTLSEEDKKMETFFAFDMCKEITSYYKS